MARDQLFQKHDAGNEPFRFDANVAGVFDDMIRRSIPGYDALLGLLPLVAARFAQPRTNVYDLGCSLGSSTLALSRGVPPGTQLIAIDQSEAMVERCRAVFAADELCRGTELRCEDARRSQLGYASLLVMNFTLQFLPPEDRAAMLSRVHQALLPGGAFVLSEKLAFEAPSERVLFEGLHDDFRRGNGYSDLEISQKRNALERVLICDTESAHTARLEQVGFQRVVVLFRALNFISYLALR